MAWVGWTQTSAGGNVNLQIAGGYANIVRNGNTVSGQLGLRFQFNNSWSSNSICGVYNGTKYYAQNRTGGSGSYQTAKNTPIYCKAGQGNGYNTTETYPWSFSTTVSGTGSGNLSITMSAGWTDWAGSTPYTYTFSVPYPAMPTIWNNINAYQPDGSTENGLIFNLSTSDGSSWSNITNEPSDFYKIPGTTATISNIRTNVTGAHYTTNDVTGSGASSFSWTFSEGKVVKMYSAWDTYTVGYNANGGTSTPSSQTKTYNVSLALRGAISKNSTTTNGYVVTFNPNTGSVSPTNKTAVDTVAYTFAGWKSSSDSKTYSAGASYTTNAASTMTAQWTSSVTKGSIATPTATKADTTATRTITFDANSGTCATNSLVSNATVSYSALGWYTASSGGTKRCNNGGSYTPSATETLYQQWSSQTGSYSSVILPTATKENSTTTRVVTFNANGGTCATDSLSSTSITTYAQDGWYTATSGGTKKGTQGTSYTPSATETLYAQYVATQGNFSSIVLPVPQRQNYIFLGWAENPAASSGATGDYVPSKSLTLYAIWELDQATVWMKNPDNELWTTGKVWYKKDRFNWCIAKFIYKKIDKIIKNINLNDSSVDIDNTRAGHTILASNKIQVDIDNSWARISCEISNLRPNTEYWIEADIINESNFYCGFYVDNHNYSMGTSAEMHKSIKIQSDGDGYIYFEFYGNFSDTVETGSVIFDNLKITARNVWIEYKPVS